MAKTVVKISFRRALNAGHIQAHGDLLNVISAEQAEQVGVKDLRDSYAALYQQEKEAYLYNRSLRETPQIEELHAARLQQFTHIETAIDNELKSPDEAMLAASKALVYDLNAYRKCKRMRYADTTGILTDFIERMRDADCAPHVETLRLTASLNQLERYNQEFNAVYLSRSRCRLERGTSLTMSRIRPLVDKAFKELANALNVLYQSNALIEKSTEQEQLLGAIIDEMNAIIYQLQLTLSRVKAGPKPNPGEEAQPTTPEKPDSSTETEPEQPSDPEQPTEPEPDIPEVV